MSSSSTLLEVFGHVFFGFTRGVTERFNPEEPEFTAESFGYSPLESTGREWYYQPVDELIYQEYNDREATRLNNDYLASSTLQVRVMDACTQDETQDDLGDEDQADAWKRLRPSVGRSVGKSLYIGALISLLTPSLVGTAYILPIYVSFKIVQNCQFHEMNTTSLQMQWIRSMSGVVCCAFLYIWFFVLVLFLFRPYQLIGVKKKLFLVCLLTYCLDTVYRVALQALGVSHSNITSVQKIPLNAMFLINQSLQIHLLTNHFCTRFKQKLTLFFQMIVPGCFCFLIFFIVASLIYPAYNQQDADGKLLIALFAPLLGTILKVVSRICAQRFYNITYPGFSFVLLSPLYFVSALIFRVLQADLDSLQSIAVLGIIHGAAEVIERSSMVVIDHIFHMIWKRKSAPWGSFRTPRRERLMADIAVMGMLSEATAIVSVNGYLYLYQFIFLKNKSFLPLFQHFALHTSVSLLIEWAFISASLAIATRYQNMAVMAVWRKRWRRHILVAIVNALPMAMWTSTNLLVIVHDRFRNTPIAPCKMPFT